MRINIPFNGFYESSHNIIIENELEALFDDHELPDHFYNIVTFDDRKDVYTEYAKLYVDGFQDWLKRELDIIIDLEFIELISPKFYNFEMDRIFCDISLEDAIKLYKLMNRNTFINVIKERHSTREGFISFYPDNVDAWDAKDISNYDANELATVLIAAIETQANESIDEALSDWDIMESAISNGNIANLVWDSLSDEFLDTYKQYYDNGQEKTATL